MSEPPSFDPAAAERLLVAFLRDYFAASGADGAVLGVSGGVDSAVVCGIAARALGRERVLGLALPHAESQPEDAAHARLVAEAFGVELEEVAITGVVEAVERACAHTVAGAARANVKARARMILLYAHANASNRLVLGTGNKSELLTGYFTKYGDGGADVYPIGDVYKTDVWALARHLGVPEAVVAKPPTAGLWAGQTDEGELGIRYADLDRLLAAFEGGLDPASAAARAGVAVEDARRIHARINGSEHKRTSLVVPKLGFRTPGLDWRLPRTRG